MRSKRILLVLAAATIGLGILLLRACTNDDSDSSSPPTPRATTPPSTTPPTPEEEALATYRRYWELQSEILDQKERDLAPLRAIASPEAVAFFELLFQDERKHNVRLTQEAILDPTVLEISEDTIKITDCTHRILTGHYRTTGKLHDTQSDYLELTTDMHNTPRGWEVGEIVIQNIPLGPFCLPSYTEKAILTGYEKYWETIEKAVNPPNPRHSGLAEVAAEHALVDLTTNLTTARKEKKTFRGIPEQEPRVMRFGETVGQIWDCINPISQSDISHLVFDKSLRSPVLKGPQRLLARMVFVDNKWKVRILLLKPDPDCTVPDAPVNTLLSNTYPWIVGGIKEDGKIWIS